MSKNYIKSSKKFGQYFLIFFYSSFILFISHLRFCIHSTFVNGLTISINHKKMDEREPSVFDIQDTIIFIPKSLKKLNSLVG